MRFYAQGIPPNMLERKCAAEKRIFKLTLQAEPRASVLKNEIIIIRHVIYKLKRFHSDDLKVKARISLHCSDCHEIEIL